MTAPKPPSPTFGFFTVVEDPALGLMGGYLIVNHRGRPIEFHCTAPIEPTRAEEILFGPTLQPHLFCERIGVALLAKANVNPVLLVVNQIESWQIADETSLPVVLVDPKAKAEPGIAPPIHDTTEAEIVASADSPDRAAQACLDQIGLDQRDAVQQQLHELVRYVDLAEPFERIAEAIREASGVNEPATESQPETAPSTGGTPGEEVHNDEIEGPHDQAA